MEVYQLYGSAKIGFLNANSALLEIKYQSLTISTIYGQFIFNLDHIIYIKERLFLFGLYRAIRIKHSKAEYKKNIFFHIPPFSGTNYQSLKIQLIKNGFKDKVL